MSDPKNGMDDAEVGSIVRVIATKERGEITGYKDGGWIVLFKTGFRHCLEEELKYLGTPGFDCPYIDDFDHEYGIEIHAKENN